MSAAIAELRCVGLLHPVGIHNLIFLCPYRLQDGSDWLLTDKVSSWQGTPADRSWRFLRQSLQQYDNVDTDYKYSKIALETIMSVDKSLPPPWLIRRLEV